MDIEIQVSLSKMKKWLNAITAIVDEGVVQFTREGMSLRAVDPANVAMVIFSAPAKEFQVYSPLTIEASGDDEIITRIGLDLKGLETHVDLIKEEYDYKDPKYLELKIEDGQSSMSMWYSVLRSKIGLLDSGSVRREPKIPELEFPAHVGIKGEIFKSIIKAMDKVGSETAEISITNKAIVFRAADLVTNELEYIYDFATRSDVSLKQLTVSIAKARYSVDYLKSLSTPLPSGMFDLWIGEDYPLKIAFTEGSSYMSGAQIEYLLAPRIETETPTPPASQQQSDIPEENVEEIEVAEEGVEEEEFGEEFGEDITLLQET